MKCPGGINAPAWCLVEALAIACIHAGTDTIRCYYGICTAFVETTSFTSINLGVDPGTSAVTTNAICVGCNEHVGDAG